MNAVVLEKMNLRATDVSGQRPFAVKNVRSDSTIGELVRGLVKKMGLAANDSGGRAYSYHALLPREGRHLHSSQLVGEVLREDDKLLISPDIQAGGG